MTVKNGKNRSPQIREDSNIRNVESNSRSVGASTNVSAKHGTYKVGTCGENSNESDTVVTGQESADSIPGKIVRQLIDENEKQLAYHEQQAELIRQRIKELKQVPETFANIEQQE